MACISNSCERVLEMLLENDDKITFEYADLDFKFKINNEFKDTLRKHKIQKFCIDILENRNISLEKRFSVLREVLKALEVEDFDTVQNKYNNQFFNQVKEIDGFDNISASRKSKSSHNSWI